MWRVPAAATASRLGCYPSRGAGGLQGRAASVLTSGPAFAPLLGLPGGGLSGRGGHPRRVSTQLGAYLERCGAVWGDVAETHEVVAAEDGRAFSWRVDLPPERLATVRRGEALESPSFDLKSGGRGRFRLFPKGDMDCQAEGMCSLWLWTDEKELGGRIRLLAGSVEGEAGASEFCLLQDAMKGSDGALEVGLRIEEAAASSSKRGDPVADSPTSAQQSLQLTGLRLAEWRVFRMRRLLSSREMVISPPFRFHHVLLGDMYLELLPGVPHAGYCSLFFRSRVPTMKLRVSLSVGGGAFCSSFVALGRSAPEADMKAGSCLQVNLDAPGTLDTDGDLVVRCELEEVMSMPSQLRDLIPKLDERANWPKRL